MTAQPNAFQQLGLSTNFAPTPLGWGFAKVDIADAAGARTMHLLMFDTVIGRLGFMFDRDALLRLSDQLREQASGLAVASDVPTNGKRKYPGFGGR